MKKKGQYLCDHAFDLIGYFRHIERAGLIMSLSLSFWLGCGWWGVMGFGLICCLVLKLEGCPKSDGLWVAVLFGSKS